MARPPPGHTEGISWRPRTGAPGSAVPEHYGPWQTCYDRFVRWRRDGTWGMLVTRCGIA